LFVLIDEIESDIRRALDGSSYPSLQLAHSALWKKDKGKTNDATYTEDLYCHKTANGAYLGQNSIKLLLSGGSNVRDIPIVHAVSFV
jgi:hypothetical protein